jgi:uncharacterized membrane protein
VDEALKYIISMGVVTPRAAAGPLPSPALPAAAKSVAEIRN